MEICDTCGVFILPSHNSIQGRAVDNFWKKEYDKVMNKKLAKRKGIKRLLYKLFSGPIMPFYPEGAFCFCSQEHYDEWKKILIKRIKEQQFALQKDSEVQNG